MGRGREGWKGAYAVAMPEQRARVLRATRSPRRILRTGPRTVAQWVMGVMGEPSDVCHSTLVARGQSVGVVDAFEGLGSGGLEVDGGGETYVQSSCLKTSSKKGIPATMP